MSQVLKNTLQTVYIQRKGESERERMNAERVLNAKIRTLESQNGVVIGVKRGTVCSSKAYAPHTCKHKKFM